MMKQNDDLKPAITILQRASIGARMSATEMINRLAVDMKFAIHIHIHIHRFSADIHGYIHGYIHIHRRLSCVHSH